MSECLISTVLNSLGRSAINVKMGSAIIENAQLLDGNRIYPVFNDLIAHVESYKATVAKWKDTDNLQDDMNRLADEQIGRTCLQEAHQKAADKYAGHGGSINNVSLLL